MLASENVANQVNSCQNNDELDALGECIFFTMSAPVGHRARRL